MLHSKVEEEEGPKEEAEEEEGQKEEAEEEAEEAEEHEEETLKEEQEDEEPSAKEGEEVGVGVMMRRLQPLGATVELSKDEREEDDDKGEEQEEEEEKEGREEEEDKFRMPWSFWLVRISEEEWEDETIEVDGEEEVAEVVRFNL